MIAEQPSKAKLQHIDMLMGSKTARMEYYDTKISALGGSYKMNVKLAKVEKPELLNIINPGYEQLERKYNNFKMLLSMNWIRKRSCLFIWS
jgi:hypothetical protein